MEDLEKILSYLSKCKPYPGEQQIGIRRTLERIGDLCALVGAGTLGFVIVAGIVHKYIHPLPEAGKTVALVAALFGELVMFVFVPVQISLGVLLAKDKRQGKVKAFSVASREHDRKNATPLLVHSKEMLDYARNCLRRRSDRIERRMGMLVGKDTAIVALFGLAMASMKGVGDIKELLPKLGISFLSGVNFGLVLTAALVLAIFLTVLSLAGRLSVLRTAYATDVLEEALNLKQLEPVSIQSEKRNSIRYVPVASQPRSSMSRRIFIKKQR
jgi:hypothetical protein